MDTIAQLWQGFKLVDLVVKSSPQSDRLTMRDMALFLVAVVLAVVVGTTRFFKSRGEEERFYRRQRQKRT
jgi:hypothetical protein